MFNNNEKHSFPIVLVFFGVGIFASRCKTSRSNQWLVKTGLGIGDNQIKKFFFQWPFQKINYINMVPNSYKFSINAMSREKINFIFPVVFTIGPKNEPESLVRFSRYLLDQDKEQFNILLNGIIEDETRTISAKILIEDIFTGRTEFKKEIVNNVQTQLNQYGLEIHNANIEELKDGDSSNYFKNLALKIQTEAENKIKVEMFEQNNICKEKEGHSRQIISSIESETILVENLRKQDILISSSVLEKTRSEQSYYFLQTQIKFDNENENTLMKRENEIAANKLAITIVQVEIQEKKAEGDANSQKILADAYLYTKQREADALLFTKIKEAEGVNAVLQAQASGLERLVSSFGGNAQALISYTMLDKDKLVESNVQV